MDKHTARTIAVTLFAALVAVAAAAQSSGPHTEIIGRYARVNPQGATSFSDIGWNYKQASGNGFGAAINFFVARTMSIEIGAGQIDSGSRVIAPVAGGMALGTLRLRPITAAVQWHPIAGSPVDPYVGAGAMYMMFDSLSDARLAGLGLDRIEFGDKAAPMANAGIAFAIVRNFAVGVDAKYAPLKTWSRARFASDGTLSEPVDIKINPLIVSAGVRFRF